jgi:hypothetical protein
MFSSKRGHHKKGPLSHHQWWVANQLVRRLSSRGQVRPNHQQKSRCMLLPWPCTAPACRTCGCRTRGTSFKLYLLLYECNLCMISLYCCQKTRKWTHMHCMLFLKLFVLFSAAWYHVRAETDKLLKGKQSFPTQTGTDRPNAVC